MSQQEFEWTAQKYYRVGAWIEERIPEEGTVPPMGWYRFVTKISVPVAQVRRGNEVQTVSIPTFVDIPGSTKEEAWENVTEAARAAHAEVQAEYHRKTGGPRSATPDEIAKIGNGHFRND